MRASAPRRRGPRASSRSITRAARRSPAGSRRSRTAGSARCRATSCASARCARRTRTGDRAAPGVSRATARRRGSSAGICASPCCHRCAPSARGSTRGSTGARGKFPGRGNPGDAGANPRRFVGTLEQARAMAAKPRAAATGETVPLSALVGADCGGGRPASVVWDACRRRWLAGGAALVADCRGRPASGVAGGAGIVARDHPPRRRHAGRRPRARSSPPSNYPPRGSPACNAEIRNDKVNEGHNLSDTFRESDEEWQGPHDRRT